MTIDKIEQFLRKQGITTFKKEIENSIEFSETQEIKVKGNAIYDKDNPKKNDNRFYLEFDIDNSNDKKKLTTIMMNPSDTFPKQDTEESKIDETVQTIIKIAYVCKYSKVIVLNLFPLINGSSNETKKEYNKQNDENKKLVRVNKKLVIKYLCEYIGDLLIAWGEDMDKRNIRRKKYIMKKTNEINLFVWDLTKKNKPRHPSRRSPDTKKKLKNFFQQPNPKLIPIKFDDNGNIVVC